MSKPLRWLTILAFLLVASGCGRNGNGRAESADPIQGREITIHVITHAGPGDGFWDVVKKGAQQAGKDLGIRVKYSNDPDVAHQSALIDTAVGEGSNGIVVSTANLNGLREAIAGAIDHGIPVITINGASDIPGTGVMTHVGQGEFVAGEGAGLELSRAGATHVLCVIQEPDNTSLVDRCNGAAKNVSVEMLQVTGTGDLNATLNEIQAALQGDDSIDGVLTLHPGIAIVARDAIAGAGSNAILGTFDNSGDVSEAIKKGEILFAVDQQQYLQGYLPVVFLYLHATNLNTVGGGKAVLTGPDFITAENVDSVAKLAKAGTR